MFGHRLRIVRYGIALILALLLALPAVALWQDLGFEILCTVPDAFDHPRHGMVGLHVMLLRL